MSLSKILSIILYAIMGFSAVLLALFYFGGVKPGAMEEPVVTDFILKWSYVLVIVAAVASILFPIIRIVTNPKAAKKSLIPILALVVVVGLAYVFSSSEAIVMQGFRFTDESVLRNVDTGLITTYILLIVAVLGIVFSEIYKAFK